MDIISFQEAKKAQKRIGDLSELITDYKYDMVGAINEVKTLVNRTSEVAEYRFSNIVGGESDSYYIPFVENAFITGIKVTATVSPPLDMRLKIFSKPLDYGGEYIYDSGIVNEVIWDVPENDIPFISDSEDNTLLVEMYNLSEHDSFFRIQIYYLEG